MGICNCNCKRDCTFFAVIVSAVLGILTAFLLISGVIIIPVLFLQAALVVALVFLALVTGAFILSRRAERACCLCPALDGLLAGVLGTILLSVVLLVAVLPATSVLGTILTGLLVTVFSLLLTSAACLIRCLADCAE